MMGAHAITRAQVRAARALLDWTRHDLAAAARVSVRMIGGFETGETVPHAVTLRALVSALEAAGIIFVPSGVVYFLFGSGECAKSPEPQP